LKQRQGGFLYVRGEKACKKKEELWRDYDQQLLVCIIIVLVVIIIKMMDISIINNGLGQIRARLDRDYTVAEIFDSAGSLAGKVKEVPNRLQRLFKEAEAGWHFHRPQIPRRS
jgi:hypothetical protein